MIYTVSMWRKTQNKQTVQETLNHVLSVPTE
jgi:hypothetical protein